MRGSRIDFGSKLIYPYVVVKVMRNILAISNIAMLASIKGISDQEIFKQRNVPWEGSKTCQIPGTCGPKVPMQETGNAHDIASSSPHQNILGASQYHLIYSPGVPGQILLSTILIHFLKRTIGMSKYGLPRPKGQMSILYDWIVLPLLSSACCAIQLFVNAVFASVGCVGFNTVLGPIRPFFLAWLLHTTWAFASNQVAHIGTASMSWSSAIGRIISFVVVSWSMALLPEALHWHNNRIAATAASTNVKQFAGSPQTVQVELAIPSMGCVACINKVSGSLRNLELGDSIYSVQEASSWLSNDESGNKAGGQARVLLQVDATASLDKVSNQLCEAVRQAGFDDCQVSAVGKVD